MASKTQLAVIKHMFLAKTYLRRKGYASWVYSHSTPGDGTMIREATVRALMQGGLITPGFDTSSLTSEGYVFAKERFAEVKNG